MKRIVAFLLVVCLSFLLCSCSYLYHYVNDAIGPFDIGYSETMRKAFLSSYHWDGSEEGMVIVTPDRYNDATIIGLGGYTGRGVPAAFMISLSSEARTQLCPDATAWYYASHTSNMDYTEVQYLRFQLHIGQHIKQIDNLSMGGIVLASDEENGEEVYNVFVLTCYVTCDDANETFYAKDGKLYYRENDVLVEDVFYDDFNLDAHNEKNKDKACWLSPF